MKTVHVGQTMSVPEAMGGALSPEAQVEERCGLLLRGSGRALGSEEPAAWRDKGHLPGYRGHFWTQSPSPSGDDLQSCWRVWGSG